MASVGKRLKVSNIADLLIYEMFEIHCNIPVMMIISVLLLSNKKTSYHILRFNILGFMKEISMCTKVFFAFSEELREHFSKYGDIESINVKTDPNTGRSRGFAFIVFNTSDAIDKVSCDDG